jgi:hypothetical protein
MSSDSDTGDGSEEGDAPFRGKGKKKLVRRAAYRVDSESESEVGDESVAEDEDVVPVVRSRNRARRVVEDEDEDD